MSLNLVDVRNLRSFTLRCSFAQIGCLYEGLSRTLHTITSPFFSEFVLEAECPYRAREYPDDPSMWWGTWAKLDEMFEKIDIERGFKLVIRAEELERNAIFIARARGCFPLMDARGGLVFEIG